MTPRKNQDSEDANPTLATLERFAEALGRQMVVFLSEPADGVSPRPFAIVVADEFLTGVENVTLPALIDSIRQADG